MAQGSPALACLCGLRRAPRILVEVVKDLDGSPPRSHNRQHTMAQMCMSWNRLVGAALCGMRWPAIQGVSSRATA